MRAPNGAGVAFLYEIQDWPDVGCIEWPYGKTSNGYGVVRVDGVKWYAHRFSLLLAAGEVPDGFEAAHNCGIRGCVAPRHLRWDTTSGNQIDRVTHGTSNRGERNGSSRLTEEQVLAIYGSRSARVDLAEHYKVSLTTIREIKNGVCWSWLTNPDNEGDD